MKIVAVKLGYRALRVAAVLALVSLGLMVWGVIDPRPISLVLAMTVGQALGTAAFGVFMLVVVNDLRRARIFSAIATRLSSAPPRPPHGSGE
jgi:hypothetical protein